MAQRGQQRLQACRVRPDRLLPRGGARVARVRRGQPGGHIEYVRDDEVVENVELLEEVAKQQVVSADYTAMRYAEGQISREMLVNRDGSAKVRSLDVELAEAFRAAEVEMLRGTEHFAEGLAGELLSADRSQVYISVASGSSERIEALTQLRESADSAEARVFADDASTGLDGEDLRAAMPVEVHVAFYRFLASLDTWEVLAGGRFDRVMAQEMARKNV